jgi:hypothetical protein
LLSSTHEISSQYRMEETVLEVARREETCCSKLSANAGYREMQERALFKDDIRKAS